jgi:hypothetical protein
MKKRNYGVMLVVTVNILLTELIIKIIISLNLIGGKYTVHVRDKMVVARSLRK